MSPQKACDKEAGVELLKQLQSLPLKETREFGFSLVETAMMLQIMTDHQKRLRSLDESVNALIK